MHAFRRTSSSSSCSSCSRISKVLNSGKASVAGLPKTRFIATPTTPLQEPQKVSSEHRKAPTAAPEQQVSTKISQITTNIVSISRSISMDATTSSSPSSSAGSLETPRSKIRTSPNTSALPNYGITRISNTKFVLHEDWEEW